MWLAIVVSVTLVLWGVAAFALGRYGRRSPRLQDRYDAIVVLGCRVYRSGRPSAALVRRVERAIELYRAGFAPTIVFTGGVGDAPVAEADVGADIAAAAGVPREAIVTEGNSTSTEENARFAAEATQGASFERVLVVTDAYHVFRAERVFARHFGEARGVGSINPYRSARFRGALREVFAIVGYGALGRL